MKLFLLIALILIFDDQKFEQNIRNKHFENPMQERNLS